MEFFYIIISIIAVIALILALTTIGLMLKNSNQTQTFPPNTSQCPDLWIPDGSFCHFNGKNFGNYVAYTTGVGKNTGTTHVDNNGQFLGDNNKIKNGTYINRYDFSQKGETGGGVPTKVTNDKDGVLSTKESITDFPMKTQPFFTFGGSINTNSTTINPYDPQWDSTGISSNCAKKKWAKLNNIEWSGISQLNTC